jgi:hypothetical protein
MLWKRRWITDHLFQKFNLKFLARKIPSGKAMPGCLPGFKQTRGTIKWRQVDINFVELSQTFLSLLPYACPSPFHTFVEKDNSRWVPMIFHPLIFHSISYPCPMPFCKSAAASGHFATFYLPGNPSGIALMACLSSP